MQASFSGRSPRCCLASGPVDATRGNEMATQFAAVGFGAALGAWLRWGLGIVLNPLLPEMPLGTFAANMIGGFLMGICMALIARYEAMSPELRLLMTTGFLG